MPVFIAPSGYSAIPFKALDFGLGWAAWTAWPCSRGSDGLVGKRGVEAEGSCFTSERYLSSYLWCLTLVQARSLNCCSRKSLFLKASLRTAHTLQLVLNWVVAKCICEQLHKMQWSLQAPDFFFQANISYGYCSNHMQIGFSPFFPRCQILDISLVFPQTLGWWIAFLMLLLVLGLFPLIYC